MPEGVDSGNNEKLFDYMTSDKLTWEGIIRDIVKTEQMDPWNINVAKLAIRFAEEIKRMDTVNFRISGKFILAASILLKMKSDFLLVEKEIEESDEGVSLAWLFKDINYELGPGELIPRIPMKKKRHVTLEELIAALSKAIEVKDRRVKRHEEQSLVTVPIPKNRIDLGEKIALVYTAITDFFKGFHKKEIKFDELLPSRQRNDVIWTFIPLLHLSTKGKIDLYQEKCFGDIWVRKPGKFVMEVDDNE